VFAKVEKYFGGLPARQVPPRADVTEGMNSAERTLGQSDALARVPAVAVGYKVPMKIGKDYVALVVLGDVLLNGDASRLYQTLVKGKELMLQVQGGLNFPFESPWRNAGPTLFSYFGLYKPGTDVRAVVDAAQAEIGRSRAPACPRSSSRA
jgi:predicted Zn-dependent peptidase